MGEENGSLRVDFHTHSTASDGTLAPAELIAESARRGLSHVALTDHDTTGGVEKALAAGARHGVVVIPGVEFSCEVERGELHILGYGVDPRYMPLQDRITEVRQARASRAERIVERLRSLGITIDPAFLSKDDAEDAIGRPHIARALVAAGVVESVSEGFDRYLGRGKPAFVEKDLVSPAEAISLIRSAGGIAVMAHPLSVPNPEALLPRMISAGLTGLECYYGEYTDAQQQELVDLAESRDLIATGGSDYHGPGFREGRDLGSVPIPTRAADRLLSLLGLGRS